MHRDDFFDLIDQLSRARRIETASDALRDFILEHPGHLPEGLLCASTCAELGPILRGEKDAVQILFSGPGAELLDHLLVFDLRVLLLQIPVQQLLPWRRHVLVGGERGGERADCQLAVDHEVAADRVEEQRRKLIEEVVQELDQELALVELEADPEDAPQARRDLGAARAVGHVFERFDRHPAGVARVLEHLQHGALVGLALAGAAAVPVVHLHVGDVGAGQVTKACNQMIVACNALVIAEVVALAEKSGVDATLIAEALAGGFADSKPLQILAPQMAESRFEPIKWHVRTLLKDLDGAVKFSREQGAATPLSGLAAQLMRLHGAQGFLEKDPATLIQLYREPDAKG